MFILGVFYIIIQVSSASRYSDYYNCQINLREIYRCKETYADENDSAKGEFVSWNAIMNYFIQKNIIYKNKLSFSCPSGGHYIIGKIDEDPICTHKDVIYPFIWSYDHSSTELIMSLREIQTKQQDKLK
jgi:hypothetical protein